MERITEQTFGPLKALCEKTTEEAFCIVNRCRTHQATAGNPCLPRCSDIYVSGVMETENCSRRSVLKTFLAGTATGILHAKEPHHDLIRLDSEYQTIEAFSASDCWSMQKLGTWSLPNRNRVADLLFSQTGGIGLSCWRFNIGGGITDKINNPWRTAETFEIAEGKYDWTRQAPERWFLGAAKERPKNKIT